MDAESNHVVVQPRHDESFFALLGVAGQRSVCESPAPWFIDHGHYSTGRSYRDPDAQGDHDSPSDFDLSINQEDVDACHVVGTPTRKSVFGSLKDFCSVAQVPFVSVVLESRR
jgi:hypothetical protein